MATADTLTPESLIDFIKSHIWALAVALMLLGMNWGIMTKQITQMETEIDKVKDTVELNSLAVQDLRLQRSSDIMEIKTMLDNIHREHQQYTKEIRDINARFMDFYRDAQRQQSQQSPQQNTGR